MVVLCELQMFRASKAEANFRWCLSDIVKGSVSVDLEEVDGTAWSIVERACRKIIDTVRERKPSVVFVSSPIASVLHETVDVELLADYYLGQLKGVVDEIVVYDYDGAIDLEMAYQKFLRETFESYEECRSSFDEGKEKRKVWAERLERENWITRIEAFSFYEFNYLDILMLLQRFDPEDDAKNELDDIMDEIVADEECDEEREEFRSKWGQVCPGFWRCYT